MSIEFERVSTLALLGREPLRILAIGAESRYVHGGDILFRRGDIADAAYVVQEGSFRLAPEERDEAGETVGPGALISDFTTSQTRNTADASGSMPSVTASQAPDTTRRR